MSGLLSRIKNIRSGAITGLNATENNLKMTGALLTPFLAMWLSIKMLLPDALYDLAVTGAMLVWLVWVVMLWAWCKSDANNFIVFPQSKWKFPDGSCRTFDLKVPPDSWEKIADFPDGTVGYRVYFDGKYVYDDPDLPYPIIFNACYWLLPSLWDEAFQRRAFGEFFHKGIFVTKPDCEDISVYVTGFEERDGVLFPIGIVNDCAFMYQRATDLMDVPALVAGSNPYYMLYKAERKRGLKLLQRTAYLEDSLDVAGSDSSENFKKSADNRLKNVRKRHARIMDVREDWRTKYLNLKNLAIVLGIIAVAFVVGRVFFGMW